jgi:hypothetical protein
VFSYRVLDRKPEGKRLLGRSRCRWEDNIKMDLREIGINVTGSEWCPVVGFCEHSNEPLCSIKKAGCLTSRVTISFSKNILHHGVSEVYRKSHNKEL